MPDSHGTKLTGARLWGGAAAVALLLAAGSAHADYKDSFKKGIDGYDRKRWDDVVKYMSEAISQNPVEGERLKIYGLRFEMYFPHFYLGAAYLNQGKCPEALRAFKVSESQGAIRSSGKYAQLVDGLKSCEGGAPSSPAPPSAPQPTPPPSTTPPTTAVPPPTLPPTPPPTLPPSTLAAAPMPAPAATSAPATPTSAPALKATPVAPRLAPPADLLQAASAYFDGDYEKAVMLLGKASGLRGRAAAQSLLLRSAARFALYKAGAEQDASLLRLAAEDAAASRRADPSLQPDGEAFSPPFVSFFRTSR